MFPLQDTVPSRDVPLVTWGLIVLNGLVFLYELSLPTEELERFVQAWGLIPARLGAEPQSWWTLLSCMFLHGGWSHFIANMWTLYLFGDNVEDRTGRVPFLAFYLTCGVAASLLQSAAHPTSEIPTIGASGAIAGVMGAYFVLFPTARVITLVPILFLPYLVEIPAVFYLGVWFLSQVFSGTVALLDTRLYAGVAWWAHVGGFVAGVVLLPLFKKSRQQYRERYPDEYWPW